MTIRRQQQSLSATNHNQRGTPLLIALGGVPELPGAACKGRPEDFDLSADDDTAAIDAAKCACQRCPALEACSDWITATPEHRRPSGVVAGRLLAPPRCRPRPERPAPAAPQPTRPSKADTATRWLAEYLADGPMPAADIHRAARAEGLGKNSVHTAGNRLDVVRQKISRREVSWALPTEGATVALRPPGGAEVAAADIEGRSA